MDPKPQTESHESYDPAFFKSLFEAEDKHFWFVARNRVIGAIVRRVVAAFAPGYRVLEVGCGTGNVLRVLEKECAPGAVTGMDLFEEGLRFARTRTTCPLIAADIHTAAFPQAFQLVGLFDVLEHLPDDRQVLRDIHRLLAPGGFLLITVPAHMSLWSYFDVASCHCRRYQLAELRERLGEAGFDVEYGSEFMAALFPLVWLSRRFRKTGATVEANRELAIRELKIVPGLNGLLTWLLSREAGWLAGRRRLPIGTSLIALARKRK